jgi:hypothetical protein
LRGPAWIIVHEAAAHDKQKMVGFLQLWNFSIWSRVLKTQHTKTLIVEAFMRRKYKIATGFLAGFAMLIVVSFGLALNVVTACGCTPPVDPPYRDSHQQVRQPGIGRAYIKSHRVTVNIENQLAVTKIEQVFVNEGRQPAEGQYLFPLPVGAAVSNLVMYINGVPIQPQLLDAKQAQNIYTETVRRLRDPALLQYVGRSAIQANVFPIPPGEQRKLEITYSHLATGDNGLINYLYPLKTDYISPYAVQQVSVSVEFNRKTRSARSIPRTRWSASLASMTGQCGPDSRRRITGQRTISRFTMLSPQTRSAPIC